MYLDSLVINQINLKKATTTSSILQTLLKSAKDICSETLKTIFNNCLIKPEFTNELKLAVVTPLLKNEECSRAENYRPVRVLPSVSKIFERILHRLVSSYVEQVLSHFTLCTNRKTGLIKMDMVKQYLRTFQRLLMLLILIAKRIFCKEQK